MSYLLDTNILSETVKRDPSPAVIAWFDTIPDRALHISVLTLGELRKGVERAPDPRRRERLRNWLEHDLRGWFEDRLLPVDHAVADRWGRLTGRAERPLPTIDSLLAATAFHHGLRIVTRNVRDFDYPELEVIDPWRAPP
ncbi:PIN domain-containing protein [Endothiovibrio diazotrophicus]